MASCGELASFCSICITTLIGLKPNYHLIFYSQNINLVLPLSLTGAVCKFVLDWRSSL